MRVSPNLEIKKHSRTNRSKLETCPPIVPVYIVSSTVLLFCLNVLICFFLLKKVFLLLYNINKTTDIFIES